MSSKSYGKFYGLVLIASLLLSTSCITRKKIAYLQDIPDSASYKVKETLYTEPLIQADDILSISIQTIDPQTSTVLNQISPPIPSVGTSSASAIGSQVITGFLVDKDGVIELPMIGKLKVSGLSTFKAREIIREKASVYFKNPTVQVRYANFKITILGEVAHPGTYTVPNEKVTLLDAIGLAGDLTIYGKRYNILLVREKGTEKEFARFDLNSSKFLNSTHFYLRQNDVIYIEPTYAKVASLNSARTQTIAILGTIASVLIVLLTRIQ